MARRGAALKEAPPAIMSLHRGTGPEAHVDAFTAGGPLLGFMGEEGKADPKTSAVMPAS